MVGLPVLKESMRSLSAVERQGCIAYLLQLRPSILMLSEDILELICTYLSDADRMAFLKAVAPPEMARDPKALRGYIRRQPFMAAFFCFERAHEGFCARLKTMADRLLYLLSPSSKRRTSSMFLVTCNWSIFTSKILEPVAMIHWSHTPPHARVDILSYATRITTAFHLANYSPVIRLTAHRTVSNREAGVRVYVHGVVMRITEEPIEVQEMDLYAKEGTVRWLMMNDVLRRATLGLCERVLSRSSAVCSQTIVS